MRVVRDREGLPALDPFRHQGVTVERERSFDGRRSFVESSVTVFLTGAECPFQCTFCDLWRYTVDGPTQEGALPAQLAAGLGQVPESDCHGLLKLYNASNWFDERAVPEADDARIVALCSGFRRVIVECHARLLSNRSEGGRSGTERAIRVADELGGRLQVALGVETVHPQALAALNKGLDSNDLRQAAAELRGWGVEIRTFVLIGAPGVSEPEVGADEALRWIERSCTFSLDLGAVAVSMIPLRPVDAGLQAPSLDLVEAAWRCCRTLSPAVQLDTWDLDRLVPDGDADAATRVAGLRRQQLELDPSADRVVPA